ncbi:MAG: SDR family NAD(P)-dependent oxidoreductase [Clostridiales bacterium]|nr:SDR family NAD(P)-dependent oxidoreductase [Clostridiales bacterium]
MKKIAVITGASSGMGKEFAETLNQYGTFDEVWAIARRKENLEALEKTVPFPVRPISLDLSAPESFDAYAALLAEETPEVALLINASGFGKFQAFMDIPLDTQLNMVDLNCKAVMALCHLTVPYMKEGGRILNIASVAAYQPIPYINIYGATKSFVLHFSRALNRELKPRGIRVMAICPFWTKTEFFDRAVNKEDRLIKNYVVMYDPKDIVRKAWKDAKKNKDVSMYGFVAKAQTLMVKLLPHKLIMNVWLAQQGLNK